MLATGCMAECSVLHIQCCPDHPIRSLYEQQTQYHLFPIIDIYSIVLVFLLPSNVPTNSTAHALVSLCRLMPNDELSTPLCLLHFIFLKVQSMVQSLLVLFLAASFTQGTGGSPDRQYGIFMGFQFYGPYVKTPLDSLRILKVLSIF